MFDLKTTVKISGNLSGIYYIPLLNVYAKIYIVFFLAHLQIQQIAKFETLYLENQGLGYFRFS